MVLAAEFYSIHLEIYRIGRLIVGLRKYSAGILSVACLFCQNAHAFDIAVNLNIFILVILFVSNYFKIS